MMRWGGAYRTFMGLRTFPHFRLDEGKIVHDSEDRDANKFYVLKDRCERVKADAYILRCD